MLICPMYAEPISLVRASIREWINKGRTTTVAGSDAVEVLVATISWGSPPSIFRGFYAPDDTTDRILLVDVEVGTIPRVAARLEGWEFYGAEVTETAFDEEFPEGTFRLELPGVEFRRTDC